MILVKPHAIPKPSIKRSFRETGDNIGAWYYAVKMDDKLFYRDDLTEEVGPCIMVLEINVEKFKGPLVLTPCSE